MSKKNPYHFNIHNPGKNDWELWYKNMLLPHEEEDGNLNTSFFGFNAGYSAWGHIFEVFNNEIFPNSDLYRIEVYGPATNIYNASWPVDIDEDGEFGKIGEDLCPKNIFEILPDDNNDQLYYVYQAIEEDNLEYGIFSSKILFIPKEIMRNKDGRQKDVSFKDCDYSCCYANMHDWTDMAVKGTNPLDKDMFSTWITPDYFYAAFYGLSAIAQDAPAYHFDEKPFPYFLKLYKEGQESDYEEDTDTWVNKSINQADIKNIMINVSDALDVEVFGFFYCEEEKVHQKDDDGPNKKDMVLDISRTHRIVINNINKIELNMVFSEVGGSDYEVFGVYSGMSGSGPHVCYFYYNQDGEFNISDDYFEFETSHDLSSIFGELDDLRNEFEIWDDKHDSFMLSEAGKEFITNDDDCDIIDEGNGWIEAYSFDASETYIYDLQDEWQLSLYKEI